MVMTMLHHARGCSRAELTKRTGLNRSTIAALVAELVDLGMAFEVEPESVVGRVGRPSPQVVPNPGLAAIAVNPDVDAIAAVFIGGAAVQGGVGTVVGAVVGGLVMGVLNMGLSILSVDAAWQMTIKGLVLLLAVAFDIFNKRRAGGR